MSNARNTQELSKSNRKVAVVCASVFVCMIGAAYAAVPLYNLFCSVTGFGGTTQVAETASDVVIDRTITVRFDGNVNHELAASLPEIPAYFKRLGGVETAFERIRAHEENLSRILLDFLKTKPNVRVLGPTVADGGV
uniref:cytochrome c oxidase assembly protein n=1 Tax=Roseibium sp. TaxID=1936156 RepID=UPI003D0F8EA2